MSKWRYEGNDEDDDEVLHDEVDDAVDKLWGAGVWPTDGAVQDVLGQWGVDTEIGTDDDGNKTIYRA